MTDLPKRARSPFGVGAVPLMVMWLVLALSIYGSLDPHYALYIVVALGVLQTAVNFHEFGARRAWMGLVVGPCGVALAIAWVAWFGGP